MTPTKILIGQAIVIMMMIAGAVWLATDYIAAAFDYDPALGAPWFSAFGRPIYYPWRIFEWWYAFEAYAPDVFFRGGSIAASGGLVAIVAAVAGSLWRARQAKNVTTYGSARWATARDVKAARLLEPAGVFLGRWRNAYLRHDGPEHVMAFAPTRSGKGVGLVVPTLLSWTGSAVIHDIKGENWTLTSGWRSTFSHCLLFDPTNPASARYNPLLEVRKGQGEVRDVQNIADILVDPEGSLERRNHWEKTGHALLVGVILHVLYAEKEKTLARVAAFLSDPARSFERTLKVMMTTNHLGSKDAPKVHPVVAQAARELLNKSENERSGVLSTAMSFLGLYRDPTIARVTETCDWRIADLMSADKPVSLYLVVPPSDISRTKPLVRLILNQIGRRLTETLDAGRQSGKRKLLMMLDEFPALGRLDFFESALAFMAGYGVRAYLIAQSLNQIEKAYGPNNSILDNCHVRVAFAANDERTAKRISDALGTATELRVQKNYAGHRLAPWLAHVMVSRQETARPLLTPGEVMQLPADQAIALVAGAPPIRAKKLRYFEDANFTARVLPAPALGDIGTPPARSDDWSGREAAADARLDQPWFDLVRDCDDEGGRELKPELTAPSKPPSRDLEVDETDRDEGEDAAAARRLKTLGDETTRRAAVLDKHPQSILPGI
ncbi:MAG: conjugal transfer protein TraG [Pseudomonadota bacterium]